MKTIEQRLDLLEKKLLTPKDFSVCEYLNYGSHSVVTKSDRELILEEFEKQSTAEQQQNLSILWAYSLIGLIVVLLSLSLAVSVPKDTS